MKIRKWFICCVFMFLVGLVVPVAANGAPIKIFLNYLPEFSNYGPTDASGVAEISIGEAWVDLTIDGLPQLTDEHYEAWLIGAGEQQMISVGTFNSGADGHVDYFVELSELPDIDYRFFVVTVETDSDDNPEPDPRRTIAGIFPDPKLQIVIETPTPTLEAGVTATLGPPITPNAPGTLPVTGVPLPEIWVINLGLLMLGLGIVSLILVKFKSNSE